MSGVGPRLADRRCRPGFLDNPLRRWLADAAREVRPLSIRPGEVIADLGTGIGFLLPELLQEVGPGGKVWAVDPDPRNLALARRRVGSDPRVTFLQRSAASVPSIPSGSCDHVLLSLVLCCLVDKEGVLAEAWRLLRPGGTLLATYPRRLFGRTRRRRALGIDAGRWARLVEGRPWEALTTPQGRLVRRQLLRRPAVGAPDGPVPRSSGIPKN